MSKNELKASINQNITNAQYVAVVTISDEDKVRFVVANAASNNEFVVEARIIGQEDWDLLHTIQGNTKTVVSVKTYDQLRIRCTNYASATNYVRLLASSFNEAGGSTSIGAPTGGIVEADTINFISSDSSVDIVGDSVNGIIDFKIAGSSGSLSKYVKTVVLADWIGPSLGEYTLNIPFSFHGKANPVVVCLEEVSGDFEQVQAPVIIDSSNNVSIKVLSSPDTRFTGKVFIN